MLKWISLAIVLIATVLYFTGALEFENSANSIDISVDKDKAQELGKSIKDKLEE